jgi:DNA-binding transcriptional LysR family regulator
MNTSIELRHLRYFLAVAEELHFGRAATRLGISQPPLSQQIQRLEQELGTPLFERTRRRVALTDAGRALVEEARPILANVEGAITNVQRAGRGEMGVLTVAFAASVMFLELPQIIRRFRNEYPNVRLDLRELPTAMQLAGLRAGELDLGFARQPPHDPALKLETVLREPLLIAVGKDHPLGAKPRITLRDLAHEDFVLFPHEVAPGLHRQVLALCKSAGFVPRVVQVSRELYTTVSLVEGGVGVTIIPASVTKMGWTGVRYEPIRSVRGGTRIDMAWRVDNTRPVLNAFLSVVRDTHVAVPS